MSLRNKTVRGQGFNHKLGILKEPLSDEEKLQAVKDENWDLLIETHMRLGCAIASRYCAIGGDSDEMLSAAMLGICDAVNRIPKLEHTNYTGYITHYIHRHCSDTYRKDRVVPVPNGVIPPVAQAVFDMGAIDFDIIEFYDLLEVTIKTDRERKIVDLRSVGYVDAEIAEKLGLSKARITQIRTELARRFESVRNSRMV